MEQLNCFLPARLQYLGNHKVEFPVPGLIILVKVPTKVKDLGFKLVTADNKISAQFPDCTLAIQDFPRKGANL